MSNQLSLRNPSSWLVLGCITLLQAINGARYSIFSECSTTTISEKQHCHFSYMQLNNLMVSSEIGKLFGVLSGIAADYLPASIILIVGLIFGLVALIVTLHPIKKSSPQVMPEMSNDYFESTTKKLAVREREIEEKVNEEKLNHILSNIDSTANASNADRDFSAPE
ncbi:hypothetical protein JCGZ_03361 [Jatropha curcas]|uniref:Nodulin-like domain-containing protein n=1 Tax=Jatropha curcas TaxID=180498 RepID=A0A067JNW9_JATCU|nr:hypothetical protein JCGZ_03361 [Jatropha curcas]